MKDSPGGTLEKTGESDAALQGIEVSPGKLLPDFWGERTSFAVMLPSTADAISIRATATQPGTVVRINGEPVTSGPHEQTFVLTAGRQVFHIEVTAEDGSTTRTYQVKVQRAAPTPDWVKVLDAAPWAPRDSAGEVVFNGRMWILGGYVPELVSDVWSSPDGETWENSGSVPAVAGINIPVNFVYDGRMWVSSNDGKLFASADGREWTMVSDQVPCLPRYGAGGAVFAGRMWILGGAGGGTAFNDVWSSADGVQWTQELAAAPWSRRQLFGNVVVHDNKLWVIGGGLTHYQPFKAYRDVWCSTDGREWTQVTDEAPWPARIWSCCIVYRGRLWLLGGFRSQPTWNNFNDVWYSADGAHWQELQTEHVWEPRHELCPYVHDNRLWVIGGNAWPLMNDVWQLYLSGLAFTSQPVLEEFVHCRYKYQAHADFNADAGPLEYCLSEAPSWLAIDTATGVVTGTPPTVGDFPVTIEVHDGAGEIARQSYTLSVIAM